MLQFLTVKYGFSSSHHYVHYVYGIWQSKEFDLYQELFEIYESYMLRNFIEYNNNCDVSEFKMNTFVII